jgi:hypothetical protein
MERPLSYQAKCVMLCWLCFQGDKKMLELYELNVLLQAAETLGFTAAAAPSAHDLPQPPRSDPRAGCFLALLS